MTQKLTFSRKLLLAFGVHSILTLSTAIGQTTADTSAAGTWVGTLEAGGARLRLVLHINVTNTGTFAGTVDSPDKGIKGILLSRVYANGDSLVVAISSALAGYEGKFSNKKATIEGIWKENGTVFPMELKRLMDTTESEALHDYPKNGNVSLYLQKTSQHFDEPFLQGVGIDRRAEFDDDLTGIAGIAALPQLTIEAQHQVIAAGQWRVTAHATTRRRRRPGCARCATFPR